MQKNALELDNRLYYPATSRNRSPILKILKQYLPKYGTVLEVASGSGEHITYFAQNFENLEWQPSDSDSSLFPSINSWISNRNLKHLVHPPIKIDTRMKNWPICKINNLIGIIAINL